jgi:hypothetical protein
MLYADDLSTDPKQILAYVLIGMMSGLAGALFVRLNALWMAFKSKRQRSWWLFRNKYAWSTLVILVYTLLTIPAGPCGSYLSKSTGDGINELFANDLNSDWTGGLNWSRSSDGGGDGVVDGAAAGGGDGDGGGGDGRGGVGHGGVRMLVSLCMYTGWRFLFLIVDITLPLTLTLKLTPTLTPTLTLVLTLMGQVGITLPLPCGVFAPTLAIGAGIGRLRHLTPIISVGVGGVQGCGVRGGFGLGRWGGAVLLHCGGSAPICGYRTAGWLASSCGGWISASSEARRYRRYCRAVTQCWARRRWRRG